MNDDALPPLEPCPFCGGEAASGVSWHEHYGECGWVECVNCAGGMGVDMGGSEAEARAAWNRRDGQAAAVRAAVEAERRRILKRAASISDSMDLISVEELRVILEAAP